MQNNALIGRSGKTGQSRNASSILALINESAGLNGSILGIHVGFAILF